RSAGVGMIVAGPNVLLLGGRIQESADVGLRFQNGTLSPYSRAVRIVGGLSYPAELPMPAFARLYPTPALQDSLLGNARDTATLYGPPLRSMVTVGPRLPLRIGGTVVVDSGGTFIAQPGARIFFGRFGGISVQDGGRLWSRGSAASPVLLTAIDPAVGWGGLHFGGWVASTSYVTNTRLELTGPSFGAIMAFGNHRVIVDSSVIRQTAFAAVLYSPNSRLMRTRVDTTLNSDWPAVQLAANARIESTRIRASAGIGLEVQSYDAVVASCEIRDGEKDGIVMTNYSVPIHNCNLVNNPGVGIRNQAYSTASVTGNWWGSTGGPAGPGGDGAGGPLIVSPWRTTPFVLPYLP
ncbi:MAG TPA: right-handed parallel beta-helix repeat-containing protein, partial [Longimicrobium sp.]|nr:right-handed parallel beta-helix repeat-containing protein [Longimicrobium sp.]